MLIRQLSISNYKSLREVTITPGHLCVIMGANAAGKSNFADCVDFISEVYRHGLEMAVQRKGGYENIAFRRKQRSKQPIKIQLTIEVLLSDILLRKDDSLRAAFKIDHSFAFVAHGSSIRTPYQIIPEDLAISEQSPDGWN